MAGGPLANNMACLVCFGEGELNEANRVYEGIEDDQYACAKGHRFGVSYRRGPATEPMWPPEPALLEALKKKPPG